MSYWFIDSLIDWFYWSACALWDYILDFLWLSLLHTQNSGWWTIFCTVNNDISRVDNKTVLTIYEIKNHVTTVLWSTLDKSLCIGTCELVNCYIFNWTSKQLNNTKQYYCLNGIGKQGALSLDSWSIPTIGSVIRYAGIDNRTSS